MVRLFILLKYHPVKTTSLGAGDYTENNSGVAVRAYYECFINALTPERHVFNSRTPLPDKFISSIQEQFSTVLWHRFDAK